MKNILIHSGLLLCLAGCGSEPGSGTLSEPPQTEPYQAKTEVVRSPMVGRVFTVDRSKEQIGIVASGSCQIRREELGAQVESCDFQYLVKSRNRAEIYEMHIEIDSDRYSKLTTFGHKAISIQEFDKEWALTDVNTTTSDIRINVLQKHIEEINFFDTLRCRTTSLFSQLKNFTPERRGNLAVFDSSSDILFRLSNQYMPFVEVDWLSGEYIGMGVANLGRNGVITSSDIEKEVAQIQFNWDHTYAGLAKKDVAYGQQPSAIAGYGHYKALCDWNYGTKDSLGAYNAEIDGNASIDLEEYFRKNQLTLKGLLNWSNYISESKLDDLVKNTKTIKIIEVKK